MATTTARKKKAPAKARKARQVLTPDEQLTKALVKASSAESDDHLKEDAVLQCLIAAFDKELQRRISPSATIVWSTIDDRVIVKLGDGTTDCIEGKGFQCPQLAVAFQALKDNNLVSLVSDLVKTIAKGLR